MKAIYITLRWVFIRERKNLSEPSTQWLIKQKGNSQICSSFRVFSFSFLSSMEHKWFFFFHEWLECFHSIKVNAVQHNNVLLLYILRAYNRLSYFSLFIETFSQMLAELLHFDKQRHILSKRTFAYPFVIQQMLSSSKNAKNTLHFHILHFKLFEVKWQRGAHTVILKFNRPRPHLL